MPPTSTECRTRTLVLWGPQAVVRATLMDVIASKTPPERWAHLPQLEGGGRGLSLELGEVDGTPTLLQLWSLPDRAPLPSAAAEVAREAHAVLFLGEPTAHGRERTLAAYARLRDALGRGGAVTPVVALWCRAVDADPLPTAEACELLPDVPADRHLQGDVSGRGIMSSLRRLTELAVSSSKRSERWLPQPQLTAVEELELPGEPQASALDARPRPQHTVLESLELPLPEDPSAAPQEAELADLAFSRVLADEAVSPLPAEEDVAPLQVRLGSDLAVHPWGSSDGQPVDAKDPVIGQVVGPCRIHRKIGEGGMGAVYLAQHPVLHKDMVVKVLKPAYANSERRVKRFFQEARAAARVDHPNVIAIQDVGTNAQGLHYILMQYLEGENLFERLLRRGVFEPAQALEVVRAIAEAMQAMHAVGVIHRDIKPENVVITPNDQIRLIDFGLAKDLQNQLNLTAPGAMVGTPLYMAPEIGRSETIDGRADVYSLGLTLYALLAGRPPFEGYPIHHVIFGKARLRPLSELNPKVEAPLLGVLARMLAWDRRDRYPSAEALIEDLDRVASGKPPAALAGPVPRCLGGSEAGTRSRPRPAAKAPAVEEPDEEALALSEEVARAQGDPARRVADYLLLSVLEERSKSVVYRGYCPRRKQLVAVHLMRGVKSLSPVYTKALAKVGALEHPHLSTLLDSGVHEGQLYLVSTFIAGASLRTLFAQVRDTQPLEPGDAARVLRDAARALAYAQDQGAGHGWLRPGSVWIDERGQGFVVDFGLACMRQVAARRLPERAQQGRSGRYLPPERRSGVHRVADPGADVYALGILLYQCLTGEPPSSLEGGEVAPPTELGREVVPDLEAICLKSLAVARGTRYETPAELADDLDRFLHGAAPAARGFRAPQTLDARLPWLGSAILVGAFVALLLLLVALT
ncbi:MAG: serine/threonine protein kinase [Planctomycetes bacterium]|nr:serine/threonine protein kinase [Planctomycetota bacterium]